MPQPFLSELNEAQRAAVVHTQGPSLVIAGAGSGKTRVLTYRIAYLLASGIPASNILALTFTNKAAREMKERINKLVGEKYARNLWMGTFHSIFSKILRHEAERIGYRHDYSIYDSADAKSLIKQIIKEMQLDEKIYKPAAVLQRISTAKNYLLSPTDYASNLNLIKEDEIARQYRLSDIFFLYNKRLKAANSMDFDDLLFNMHLLLTTCPDIREKYSSIFRYILVDEYQDTNHCQAHIISLLAQPENNICVVGDDAQSIYSFRGANIDNILRFTKTYQNAQTFKLERNYRSTQNIVNAANSIIEKNIGQIPKHVFSENEQGKPLQLSLHSDDRQEASFITRTILNKHINYSNFAVLYRTNAQSRVIEDELRKLNIPYRIYGSVSFYQRKEIKDAIAYFRLIVNPNDDEALIRAINTPARGIGDTTVRRVLDCAHHNDTAAFNIINLPYQYNLNCSIPTYNKLKKFAFFISSLREQANTLNAYDFALLVMQQSQLLSTALADKSSEGQERYQNLQELLSSINEFCQQQAAIQSTTLINDFLAEVSLLTDQDQNLNDDTPRVSLMTVHAAKGLEFPIVFIAGMEEKLFPSPFAEIEREIEEERRLFYVAITRAQQEVYITHAQQRFRNGQIQFSTPSRFLKEINPQYIEQNDNTLTVKPRWSTAWIEQEFEQHTYNQPKPTQHLSKIPNSQTQTARQTINTPFSVGQRVNHATFGNGTVLSTYQENDNQKIDIQFDKVGKKTLLLKFARLTNI